MTKTLHRGRSARGVALATFVFALTALLVACDSGTADVSDGSPTSTPTRTPVGTTPTMEPTSTETGTAIGTATPSATAATQDDIGWGVATVNVATGEVASLYEGAEAILLPEARNNGIWLSVTQDEAVRYALDGTVEERLAGQSVLEGPGGRVRSYFTGPLDTATMIVEHPFGDALEVEGRRIANRTFTNDGRWLAWLDWTDTPQHRVMAANLETGEIEEIAAVSPCACDGYHYIEWSPSGRYLAYENPDYQDASVRGVYIQDIQSDADGNDRDPVRLPDATPVFDGWLEADETEFLLTLDGRIPTLHPVDEEAKPVVISVDASSPAVRASTLQSLVTVSLGTGTDATTLIFDPVSGERVRELRGVTDSVLTEDGIATASITRNDIACTGVEVDHPAFKGTLDCTAEDLLWSPDGRYLAMIPQAQSAPVEVLDVTTGETTELPHAGPRGTVPEWSEDGRYLVWVWGGQL